MTGTTIRIPTSGSPAGRRLSCFTLGIIIKTSFMFQSIHIYVRRWIFLQDGSVPMAADSQQHEQAQKLKKLFHQTKRALYILWYVDETDESIKPVLNAFAGYEHNHKCPSFSTDDGKYVTANLINIASIIKDPRYNKNLNKPIIQLSRFIKAHGVDHVRNSYKECLQFTSDKACYDSFQHHLRLFKL